MTCCCEGPLGAVRLLDLPSWFTAVPCTPTASKALSSLFTAERARSTDLRQEALSWRDSPDVRMCLIYQASTWKDP